MKVLIAEDNSTSRLLLDTILRKAGYETVVTCDGDEAWAALQEEGAPKLAILDWMMPGMTGVDVCRKVRQLAGGETFYVIMLTALDREDDIIEGLEAGANDYVSKPFKKNVLLARVRVGQRVVELQSALASRVVELEGMIAHVKTLQGIVPICMHCHKIRDDDEAWQKLEGYLEEHSEAEFSHSLCPECLEKYYPDSDDDSDEGDAAESAS